MSCFRFTVVWLLLASFAGIVHGQDATPPSRDCYGDQLPPGALARLGTIRLRHAHADVTFSVDGKQLISCAGDGELRFWDVATGKLLQRNQLDGTPQKDQLYQKAIFSPNGKLVAIRNGWSIRLYDARTGKERGRLGVKRLSQLRSFSANGNVLALQTSEDDGYGLQLWNTDDCKLSRAIAAIEQVPVALTADGKRLAAFGADEKLRVWDTPSGKEISKRESKDRIDLIEGPKPTLAFSPDGKLLAVAVEANGKVELRDGATLKTLGERRLPADLNVASIEALTFSPDGQWLVGSYIADGVAGVALWDMKHEKRARRLAKGGCISRFAFSPDGRTLAGHDAIDSEIRLWQMPSGRPLLRRPGHNAPVKVLAISPDGRTLVSADDGPVRRDGDGGTISNENQPTLHLWDAATGKLLHVLEGTTWIIACLFSPDGKRVISAGIFGEIEIWDVATGEKLCRFDIKAPEGEDADFRAVGLSADGKRLSAVASLGGISSEQLFVYDLAAGKQRARRPYRGLQIEHRVQRKAGDYRVIVVHVHATIAPDGESVSVGRDGWIGLEDIATGCLLTTLPKDVGAPLVFSPDGRLVAAIAQTENRIDESRIPCLIETASGGEVVRLEKQVFEQIAFAPDGYGLVMVSRKSLRVWDTDTGALVHEMAWPESIRDSYGEVEISSLAVLPGGRAATGMREGEILIWDLHPSTWLVPKASADLGAKELEVLWSDLAGAARSAHHAISRLSATPRQSVPWMKDHLRPVEVDVKRIDKLLANLDGDVFEARQAASEQLARMRYRAEPMLRRALEGKPSLELRRRIEAILVEPRRHPVEALRTLRAIAILERIGMPEARRLLKKLAGAAAAPETVAAQAALQRLDRSDIWTKERASP